MNVQMAHMLQSEPKTLLTFKNNMTLLNQCMSDLITGYITPVEIQKIIGKELKLKEIWEEKLSEFQKSSVSDEKKPADDSLGYYS